MEKRRFLTLLSLKFTSGLSDRENEQLEQAIQSNAEYEKIAYELTRYFGHKDKSLSDHQDKLREVWKTINDMESKPEFIQKYDFRQPANLVVFRLNSLLKIAAVLFIILSTVLLIYNFYPRAKLPVFISLSTNGNKLFKTLEDGTKIWLNRGSSLKYNNDFGLTKREIFLEGEAFFDVAKNAAIPLFIHTGNINIEVKGTAFNVNAWKIRETIEVSLIRGLIEVSNNLENDRKILLKANEKLIIPAGVSLTGENKLYHIALLDSGMQAKDIKWTRDSLTFKKEKLKNLVVQLEYKYKVKIEIRNEKLKNKQFTGVLRNELLTEALDALKLSYPFTYTFSNKQVIIK